MTPCTCTPLLHVRTPNMSYTPAVINGRFWSKLKVVLFRCLSGFTDKEFDDVKGIFLDTSAWLFGLTIFISVFHVSKSHGKFGLILNSLSLSLISFTQLLFDFLAFKNDISFWRQRKTMVGLSSRVSKSFIKEYTLSVPKYMPIVCIGMRRAIISTYILSKIFHFLVIWRCFSYTVVFLYLLDEQTSLLVLVPAGIASVIEVWMCRTCIICVQ